MRILLKGMSMNNLIKLHIHQQVQDFLRRINQNDRQSLLKYNQVTDENFMIESNIYNFKKITDLKLQVYVVEQESSFNLFDPLFRW